MIEVFLVDRDSQMVATAKKLAPMVVPRLAATLEFIVKVIAIAVPVLYALGRIYAGAYWQQLRIPASLMDYSTEDFLYLGFVSIFSISARVLGVNAYSSLGYAFLTAVAIAVLTLALGIVNHWLSKLFSLPFLNLIARVRRLRSTKHEPLVRAGLLGADLGASVLFLASIALLLVALAVLPIYFVLKEARRHALSDLNQITSPAPAKDGDAASFAHLKEGNNEQVLPLFQCAPKWCVVLVGTRLTAVPEEKVTQIDSVAPAAGALDPAKKRKVELSPLQTRGLPGQH